MKNSRSIIAKRHNYILQKLNAEHSVIVEDLTAELNVSALTIRRDLDDLAAQGKVERFFGGARILSYETQNSYSRLEPSPLPIDEYEEKKRKIAEYAASMVKEGDTILINSSTTAFYMFHLLSDMNITIITNNANALHT
ncbi:MAG: DeoR/GlpR family DNA-binding transcription regulator, partial [Treponema sp.]